MMATAAIDMLTFGRNMMAIGASTRRRCQVGSWRAVSRATRRLLLLSRYRHLDLMTDDRAKARSRYYSRKDVEFLQSVNALEVVEGRKKIRQ